MALLILSCIEGLNQSGNKKAAKTFSHQTDLKAEQIQRKTDVL